jgi:hypothetical protein
MLRNRVLRWCCQGVFWQTMKRNVLELNFWFTCIGCYADFFKKIDDRYLEGSMYCYNTDFLTINNFNKDRVGIVRFLFSNLKWLERRACWNCMFSFIIMSELHEIYFISLFFLFFFYPRWLERGVYDGGSDIGRNKCWWQWSFEQSDVFATPYES